MNQWERIGRHREMVRQIIQEGLTREQICTELMTNQLTGKYRHQMSREHLIELLAMSRLTKV
ncbi:hypothetical protein LCGC14_0876930 [marine sediment metagenome]|uniref:Uncharacterized protein n=1 Tax=marine sediment metagenome TaxID=412755 RepID=A0A0F9P2Z4_9ZZZZ